MMALFSRIPLSTVIGARYQQLLKNVRDCRAAGWHWMFLLEGLCRRAIGILVFFRTADRPRDAKFLTPEQKQWLETTLAAEPGHHVAAHFSHHPEVVPATFGCLRCA